MEGRSRRTWSDKSSIPADPRHLESFTYLFLAFLRKLIVGGSVQSYFGRHCRPKSGPRRSGLRGSSYCCRAEIWGRCVDPLSV